MKYFKFILTGLNLIARTTQKLPVLYRMFTTKSYWLNMVKAHLVPDLVDRLSLKRVSAHSTSVVVIFCNHLHHRIIKSTVITTNRIARIVPMFFARLKAPRVRSTLVCLVSAGIRAVFSRMSRQVGELLTANPTSPNIRVLFIPNSHTNIITHWDSRA